MGDKVDISKFRRGDKLASGYVIKDIVGRDENLLMVTTLEDHGKTGVYWVSRDGYAFSAEQNAHVLSFSIRYNEVKEALPQDEGGALELLAETLFGALRMPEQSREQAFGDFDQWFQRRKNKLHASARVRTTYMVAATAALASIVAIATLRLDPSDFAGSDARKFELSNLFIGATAGAIGAWCSVIQKLRQLDLSMYQGRIEAGIAAVSRVLLGLVFGAVGYLAAVSGFVLTLLLQAGPGVVLLIGFVAGISERLVPDVVADFEIRAKQKGKGEQKPMGAG